MDWDADWAGDVSTRKSTTGYLFRIGNGTVSWKTGRQSIVALSSTEAEYASLSCAAQETIWMRNLLESIGFQQLEPTMISEVNQGAIALAGNLGNHPKTKHIGIKYHFIREAVEKNKVLLQYCPTKEILEHILTEALPKESVMNCGGASPRETPPRNRVIGLRVKGLTLLSFMFII